MTDWKTQYKQTRPLTNEELQKIWDDDEAESDCSGSEVEDNVEYEPFECSGSEYVPSNESDDSNDMLPGPSKRRKIDKSTKSTFTVEDKSINVSTQPKSINDPLQEEAAKQDLTGRESELENSDSEKIVVENINRTQVSLKGKDGHRWSAFAGKTARNPMKNKVHIIQGPTGAAKEALNPCKVFELLISDTIIDKIVMYTNAEILVRSQNYKDKKATISATSPMEIKALIGLLIFSAALKDNHLNSQDLFDESLCGTTYKAVMSRERFKFLINCLRFDDKDSRKARQDVDPFAPIREIWEELIFSCKTLYKAGSYVTIDEQLLAFRGRCPFRMYIPNKPAKYGIKIVMVCDAGTKYMIDASPYVGKKTITTNMPLAEHYVKSLTSSTSGANRNITMDNWFSSVKLADDLLEEPHKFTMVGTLRKNKREIPPEMLSTKGRSVGDARYCFDKQKTLLSYVPKRNKNVLVLSTMHSGSSLKSEKSEKPDMIEFYNATKGGVDTFDQMCGNMSTSRKTKRWPLCIFYGMLNISSINSYIIYTHNKYKLNQRPSNRKQFMVELSRELTSPWMKHRLGMPSLQRSIRTAIQGILKIEPPQESVTQEASRRTTCQICPAKKRRMTTNKCNLCKRPFCLEHRGLICSLCS